MNNVTKVVYQKARELYEEGSYEKAESILKRLFKEDSHDIAINHLMAIVMLRLDRDTDKIAGHLSNLLYLKAPKSMMIQGYLLLGYLYLRRGHLPLAQKYLRELEELPCEHIHLYGLLAYLSYQKRDFVEAEKYYKKVLSLDPNNANGLNGLGCTYLEMNTHREDAYRYIKQALAQDEDNYAYLESMGWYYLVIKNLKNALGYFKRSINIQWHAITESKIQTIKKFFRHSS